MSKTGAHKIRPAGRLILTIGRDLIQDPYAAVVELVKNAYDADSPVVNIEFSRVRQQGGYSITISDHGHGMTRADVINKWMVPSTSDKLNRRKSPSGRVMQGRKGVGRYAASVLGRDLYLETVSSEGEKTEVYIDWSDFENSKYLDDIQILIESSPSSRPNFWTTKFQENVNRDKRNIEDLLNGGWRVMVIWECSLRGKTADLEQIGRQMSDFLNSGICFAESAPRAP